MDRIIALYKHPSAAEEARVHLGTEGFPTDRVDLVSAVDRGRVVDHPDRTAGEDLSEYFSVLLNDDGDQPVVDNIVRCIQAGKAAVVVHPRGKVEVEQAEQILEAHTPDTVFWRVAPEEAQGGLLGEHAAGFKA